MKTLTPAAIEVLGMIAVEPRETTRTTRYDCVSGASAAGLVRKGYAKRIYDDLHTGFAYGNKPKIGITELGMQTLAEVQS